MRDFIAIFMMLLAGYNLPLEAKPLTGSNMSVEKSACLGSKVAQIKVLIPKVQGGTISIQDDVYLAVFTEAFAVTVKTVRIYTDASKSSMVMGLEGCGNSYCSYNLVTAGLAAGTYFVEVETYSSTFFSNWITYE